MILTENEIKLLVKGKQNPVVAENVKLQDDHKVHIQGSGFENVLKQIIGYENVEAFAQKKLLTKPFTRPIFKKIINAQSRWKNALGTTRYYKFGTNSDKVAAQFQKDILSSVWKNQSIETLVKKFLYKALYEEFNGYFVVEKPALITEDGKTYLVKDGIKTLYNGKDKLKPYIVFKCASEVYTFKQVGDKVEFMIFDYGWIERGTDENKKKYHLFRVLDDERDYIVEKDDQGNVKISEDPAYKTIEHKAGECPVVCITTINKSLTNDQTRTSPVDDIISLLDYHLHQFAEHLITEVLHAHPNFFQVGQKCTEIPEGHDGNQCKEGRIIYEKNGATIDIECPACKGTGHNLHKDASTTIILPAKDENGNPFNLTNIAGYVAPPVDALKYQEAAIDWMEDKILDAALGINNVSHGDNLNNTATGAMINIKPLEDIISDNIDIIEGVEKRLTDIIARMYYGDRYKGCEILYGRKIALRDESSLLKELKESKAAGTSYNHLKTLNEELTYSRFIRSEYDLQRSIILNELEPLIGFTFDEVEKTKNVPDTVKRLKQNFVDFIQRFESENGNIVEYKPELEMPKKITEIKEILVGYSEEVQVDKEPLDPTNPGNSQQV